jgi:hypothetical protein
MRLKQFAHFFFLLLLSILLLHHFVYASFSDSHSIRPKPTTLRKSVWTLYLGMWGNPSIDKQWFSWRYPERGSSDRFYEPPFNIPSLLYPQLGLYSSHDRSVLRHHCSQMYSSGIDGIIFEWWGSEPQELREINANSENIDQTLDLLLSVASEFDITVGINIKGYPHRSAESICRDVHYIQTKYGNRTSLLKIEGKPVIFVYDPHTIENIERAVDWISHNSPAFLIATVCDKISGSF